MAFEKGKSGNPSGRPAKSQQQIDFEYKCRNWASLYAFEKLKKCADSEDIKAIQAATKELLDRAFGKSVETSIVDATIATEAGTSVEAITSELAEALGSVEIEGDACAIPPKMDSGE